MISHVLICVYVHLKRFRIHSTPLHRKILEPLVFLSTYDDMNPNCYSFVTVVRFLKHQDTASKQSESLYGHFVVPPMRSATRSISRPIPSQSCVPSWVTFNAEKVCFVFTLFQGRETTRGTVRTFFRYNYMLNRI